MTHAPHHFPLRIYYEDTDHGGVVYYANYLKYMERARTELMRDCGIELDQLQRDAGILFAVNEAHVHYRRPARFNDALNVQSDLVHARGARLAFHQSVWRDDVLLVEAEIRLACMDIDGHARRIPKSVLDKIAALLK
ncbi:MAG: tol-pal system-associated acyl-CoA thioesterase [Mariprofundaceae bacterium]|nr:tol-pal system-associated acyl-CoA thioesterase [Mariprofundaceae bacterium]